MTFEIVDQVVAGSHSTRQATEEEPVQWTVSHQVLEDLNQGCALFLVKHLG